MPGGGNHGFEASSQPAPTPWWEVAYGVILLTSTVGLSLIAAASNLTALRAVTNVGWYCWLLLCSLSAVGIFLAFLVERRGLHVPLYCSLVLWIGAFCGIFTFDDAWKVITEPAPEQRDIPESAHLDLRNQLIRDTSFAERNLRGSNFSGATLTRVDLSGANLSESDLREATFNNVDFSGTDLCGVDLRGADMRGGRGLRAVQDWSYVFYDNRTRLPGPVSYLLMTRPGPIPDNGHDLLYMCKANLVRRLRS
ncbi:MAG TPA: pentapeptide repeat-containing protein [Solirubrobacterales bacterium]|nr:pentapeptide repeat-containing protein [Solirubrobacterales bacterium]